MKTFSEVAHLIRSNCTNAEQLALFAFGSRLNGCIGEDYDILLIEDDFATIDQFRDNLLEPTRNLPIHLTVLTHAEVIETGFLEKCKAVSLSSLF